MTTLQRRTYNSGVILFPSKLEYSHSNFQLLTYGGKPNKGKEVNLFSISYLMLYLHLNMLPKL